VAGRFPGYLVVNAAGAQAAAGKLTQAGVLLAALAVLAVLGYARRDALLRRFAGEAS
jgi:hypothetical protein